MRLWKWFDTDRADVKFWSAKLWFRTESRTCGHLRPGADRRGRSAAATHLRHLCAVPIAPCQVRTHSTGPSGLPRTVASTRRAYRGELRRPLQRLFHASLRRLRPRTLSASQARESDRTHDRAIPRAHCEDRTLCATTVPLSLRIYRPAS